MTGEVEPTVDGDRAPHRMKDLIKEALFERRRVMFSEFGRKFVGRDLVELRGGGGVTLWAPHGYVMVQLVNRGN